MNDLPRLLYVSDVPVERSLHGSLLLFRLLEKYPADRLRVIEGSLFSSRPERRLPGVTYRTLRTGWARLQHCRFTHLFAAWQIFSSGIRAGRVQDLLDGFQPEAVLTVTYFYTWMTAAAFARRRRVPLHLIHHDECVETPLLPVWVRPRAHRIFARAYRQAASRFCVSPYMVEDYAERYGEAGEVLFPSRAADAPPHTAPPARLGSEGGNLNVAFGGTINTTGQRRQIKLVCDAVGRVGGTVHLFGPHDPARYRAEGFDGPHVQFRGLLSPEQFKERLRQEADVLLVPMNTNADDARNARISFPSKLVDYTAVGLPLLIIGPDYCSAVRWAKDHPGVAEVVTGDETDGIMAALERLRSPRHRVRLAEAAIRVGDKMFSHERAWTQFRNGLTGTKSLRGGTFGNGLPQMAAAPLPPLPVH